MRADLFQFLEGDHRASVQPELLAENRWQVEPDACEPGTGKVILAVQSYLVRTPHHVIPGNGAARTTFP